MQLRFYFPILLFFCGFQGWILSFPLYGTVLTAFGNQRGVDTNSVVSAFLLTLSISYVGVGFLLSKISLKPHQLRIILLINLLITLFLGIFLFWLPANLWMWTFILLGLLGSLPPLIWLSFVTVRIPEGKRGLIFGLTGFFIEFTIYGMNLLVEKWSVNYSFFLLQLILFIPLIILTRYPRHFHMSLSDKYSQKESIWRWWPFFLFIFLAYLGGGMMYRIVDPYVVQYPDVKIYLGNLPYAITMPFIGLLIDRIGARPFTFIGSVLLGIGFALFAITPSYWGVAAGLILIKVGFAFLDLFILYFLAFLAFRKRNFAFLGIGIGINMISILSGSFIGQIVHPNTGNPPTFAFIIAIMIVFISFLLIEWAVGKDDLKKQHIEEELQLAHEVQQNLLPLESEFPENLEIFALLQPVKEVGGDFYDVISIDQDKTLFVIGDVVGKGLSGGMIASSMISHIRSAIPGIHSLDRLLTDLNLSLIRDSRSTMNVTLGLALIDTTQQTLTYSSAGHPFPFLITDQDILDIEVSSFPLGIEKDIEFEQTAVPFNETSTLVLYTDGLIETRNAQKEMFGFERLKKNLMQCDKQLPIKDLGQSILKNLKDHTQKEKMEDDLTLLIIRKRRDGSFESHINTHGDGSSASSLKMHSDDSLVSPLASKQGRRYG